MPQSAKSKTAFLYSIQVWLTSALTGPMLWYFSPAINKGAHSFSTFFQFYGAALLFVFMFSFPSFLLLFAGVVYIDRRAWQLLTRKFVITGWAFVLAIVPFLVIFDWDRSLVSVSALFFAGAYIVPLVAAIFLFRWPQKR